MPHCRRFLICSRVALLAVLPLLALSCDRPPAGPGALDPMTFEATTTGAYRFTLAGRATVDGRGDGEVGLVLWDSTIAASDTTSEPPTGVFVELLPVGGVPTPGRYAVGSPLEASAPFAAVWVVYFAGGADLLTSMSGTVTISAADSGRVAGDFDITFERPGGDVASADTSRVRGRFDASVSAGEPVTRRR